MFWALPVALGQDSAVLCISGEELSEEHVFGMEAASLRFCPPWVLGRLGPLSWAELCPLQVHKENSNLPIPLSQNVTVSLKR